MGKYNLVATAAMGLEALVANEVKALGYETKTENGKVYFQGDELAIARSNMWLRVADRVRLIVGEFRAKTFDDLFEQTKALPWEDFYQKMQHFQLQESQSNQPYIVCQTVKRL